MSLIFPLATTRGKIHEANEEFLEALDVFRTINHPSPRNWSAIIQFSSNGDYILNLSANPPLSRSELNELLDGRIPSLFAYKALYIKVDGINYKTDLSCETWQHQRETFFTYTKCDEDIQGELKIFGYTLSPQLSNKAQFKSWIYANTWFGSQKYSGRNYSLQIKDLAISEKITTLPKIKNDSDNPTFAHEIILKNNNNEIGLLCVKCSPQSRQSIRHSRFGKFRPDTVIQSFFKSFSLGDFELEIEIDEPQLHWYSNIGTLDTKHLRQLLEVAGLQKKEIIQLPQYKTFLESFTKHSRQIAALKLLERQQQLQKSPRVRWNGQELLVVPTCENELVALYMKIESLNLLPFKCVVLEYTSRAGIDALANFQLKPTAAFAVCAPVEFEYTLGNYFDHKHPFDQTALIICWNKDEDTCDGRWRNEKPWLSFIYGQNCEIPVVILENIPNLEIKSD